MFRVSIIIFILLIGCGDDSFYVDGEYYYLTDLTIVFVDEAELHCIYSGGNNGCYFKDLNLIIVERGDWWLVGHEICHAIFWDKDHKNECGNN